ncbi:MAG: RidA family protein [Planctomycetaceae bacterium]
MHHTDMSAEARVKELGLVLPPAPKPVATYVPCVRVGNLLYVSGHGPLRPDRTLVTGRVGAELNEAHGREAARVVGLAMLATLQAQLGTLDRVVRLIKTLGMVNSAPDFLNHPQVVPHLLAVIGPGTLSRCQGDWFLRLGHSRRQGVACGSNCGSGCLAQGRVAARPGVAG